MPRQYSPEVRRQVIELARAGTKVKQLARTFQVSEATIYSWLKQDRIDLNVGISGKQRGNLGLAFLKLERAG